MRNHVKQLEHLEMLVAWAKDKSSQQNNLFLIESLAPLVLGLKPAVLLNVSLGHYRDWQELVELLIQRKTVRIKEIRTLNGRLQVLFYQRPMLNSLLQQESIRGFLRTLGYPKQYSLDLYLNQLKEKMRSEKFPHEIGVFLGYPLKDVLGFMGLLPLAYKRTQGWRIYGDETTSNEVYDQYRKARCLMREIASRVI